MRQICPGDRLQGLIVDLWPIGALDLQIGQTNEPDLIHHPLLLGKQYAPDLVGIQGGFDPDRYLEWLIRELDQLVT